MCFINEADWYASVSEESDPVAAKQIRCDECSCFIEPGQTYHHVHQQEHEYCWDCEERHCSCPRDADGNLYCEENGCQCDEPNLGESFRYDCCSECWKFRQAIRDAEIEAGCREEESRPSLGAMFEEIEQQDASEARKYFKTCLRLFPELKASGYLGRHWKRSFAGTE